MMTHAPDTWTTHTRATFYALLQDIANDPDSACLAVCVDSESPDVRQIFHSSTLSVPHAQHVCLLGGGSVVGILPTALVQSSIAQMTEQFYQHPLVQQQPDHTVLFGWTTGTHPSATALIEAIARNLTTQRQARGITTRLESTVLALEPGRLRLQRRYDTLRKHDDACQSILAMQQPHKRIRTEVGRLTAVIGHDLSHGLEALRKELGFLAAQHEHLSPQVQEKLHWIQQQMAVCIAWQRTINELGIGKGHRRQATRLVPWLHQQADALHQQLALSFTLDITCTDTMPVSVDPQIALVVCMHLFLAAQAAGATVLHVRGGERTADGTIAFSFIDDGDATPRLTALQSDVFAIHQATLPALPWEYQPLVVVRDMLQTYGHRLDGQQQARSMHITWQLPDPVLAQSSTMMTQADLERECLQLEQDIARLEGKIQQTEMQTTSAHAPVHMAVTDREEAHSYLRPYVQQLESHLNTLAHETAFLKTHLGGIAEGERIERLTTYSHLLVRNLDLSLRGSALPVEHVDINEQVSQGVDLLAHKLAHLQIVYALAPTLPRVAIAPVEIKQVLMNIVKNAAEAMGQGGVLFVSTGYHAGMVVVQIRDTGSGIAPDNKDKIFGLHFSTKGGGGNSGVGLYAVNLIVQRAGGQIGVASASYDTEGSLVVWSAGWRPAEDMPHVWMRPGTLFLIAFPALPAP